MAKTLELPPAKFPTYHPSFAQERYPRINVFQLMPVRGTKRLTAGHELNVNVATYTDPFAEMDCHRLVASRPRWMQGIWLKINEIRQAKWQSSNWSSLEVKPADSVFTGVVTNHSEQHAVIGVMHPNVHGWLAFDPEVEIANREHPTIADLKTAIGQISLDEAVSQNNRYREIGIFQVGDCEMS